MDFFENIEQDYEVKNLLTWFLLYTVIPHTSYIFNGHRKKGTGKFQDPDF